MAVKIQVRRDTAANWTAANPILAQGEIGYETDTGNLKIGDGTTAWNALAYFTGSAVGDGLNRIAAGSQTAGTLATVAFANSNGITFGMSGSSQVTASHNGLTTAAQSDHSHGNPTLALTNILGTTASNSAGLTLSLSANAGGAGDGGNIIAAGGSTAGSTGTIVFSNSNGVSFGLNGATVTASAEQSLNQILAPAADATWLMNTRQIQFQWGVQASNFTTASNRKGLFEIDIAMSNNTDTFDVIHVHQSTGSPSLHMVHLEAVGTNATGLHISVAGPVAVVINAPISYVGGSVPMVLGTSQSNSVANFNANYLQGKVSSEFQSTGAYLTTAALSNHSHGNPTLALTNILGTTASASNGFTLSLSANAGGAGDGINAIVVNGGASTATTTLALSNSNNVSFGLNAGTITATATFAQSVQTQGMVSVNGSTGNVSLTVGSSLSFSSNGSTITFGLASNITTALQSAGAYLTTAAVSNHSHAFSASGGSSVFQTLNFANSNGITFSNSNGSVIASHNGLTTAANSTHTHGAAPSITGPVAVTSNSSAWSINVNAIGNTTAQTNVTWTVGTNGLSLNAGGYAGTLTTFAGANISASITLNSVGLNMSASVAAPGAAAENNWFALSGNTVGNSTASGSTIVLSAGANVTLSGTNGSVIRIDAGGGAAGTYTAPFFINNDLGASTTINNPQNSLFLQVFTLSVPVSASSVIGAIMSYSGTITSAATAQAGITMQAAIWSNNETATSRYDTLWTGGNSMTFWNSGTSSYSYAYSGTAGNTTGSSAGSNLGTASVMGVRLHTFPIGSVLPAGNYVFGIVFSTSSAGYSAAMSRRALFANAPASVGMGIIGAATNNSIGYAVAGTYNTTTGALPSTLALNQIGLLANVYPFFKIGSV